MLDTTQKQFLYSKIMEADTITGLQIAEGINVKKAEYQETDEALKMLCEKRGCKVNIDSPGDNTPIKLLKAQRGNINSEMQNLSCTQYIRLADIFKVLNIREE